MFEYLSSRQILIRYCQDTGLHFGYSFFERLLCKMRFLPSTPVTLQMSHAAPT